MHISSDSLLSAFVEIAIKRCWVCVLSQMIRQLYGVESHGGTILTTLPSLQINDSFLREPCRGNYLSSRAFSRELTITSGSRESSGAYWLHLHHALADAEPSEFLANPLTLVWTLNSTQKKGQKASYNFAHSHSQILNMDVAKICTS